jgi:TolA-binding protein
MQQREHHEIDFSPEALSALRSRLEALRCAAVSAAVAPARAVGKTEPQASDPAATAAAAASDAAYAAAIERVKAGDMPGAAAKLRDALFVEERPRARERIEKYLGAIEAKIFR